MPSMRANKISAEELRSSRQGVGSKPRLNTRDLFAHSREVMIEHGSEEYRLRLTSQGKLILTK